MKPLTVSLFGIVLTLTFLSGCTPSPKPAAQIETDPTLPVVDIANHLEDMTSVTFEWKSIKDPKVKGYFVYRTEAETASGELTRIATIDNRFSTHFTDADVKPGVAYDYRFTAFSEPQVQSSPSPVINVRTLPVLNSVSFFAKIGNLPRQAKLIWRPHTDKSVEYYIIERKDGDNPEWKEISKVKGRLNAEFIDSGLADNAIYHYRLRAVTFEEVVSVPSDQVKVVTKPLPQRVENIIATTNQPRQITLNWQQNPEKDLDHYRIYRSDSENGGYSYHVKTRKTSFIDKIEADGQPYFYKITAVDHDGLESEEQDIPVMGSTLTKPAKPVMVEGSYTNRVYKLSWQDGDERATSHIVVKKTFTSWFKADIEEITDIREKQFNDVNIMADTTYEYQVIAVDRNGIRSEATEPRSFSFRAE